MGGGGMGVGGGMGGGRLGAPGGGGSFGGSLGGSMGGSASRIPQSSADQDRTVRSASASNIDASATTGKNRRGGASASRISAMGKANTNGPNATDRDFGRDRASDRGANAAVGAGVNTSASVTSHHRHFGGRSSAHVSAKDRANTNGPNAADRDFGRDRSSDR
jgi:hypothetical protein